jgi:hypothetical protein
MEVEAGKAAKDAEKDGDKMESEETEGEKKEGDKKKDGKVIIFAMIP